MTGHYTRKAVISMANSARQSRKSASSSSKTKRKRSSSSSSRRRRRELAHDSQISIGTIGTAMTSSNDDTRRQSQPMPGRSADAATSSGSKSTRPSRHLPDHPRTPSASGKKRRKEEQQQIGTGPGHTSTAAATGSPLRRAMTRSRGPSLSITSSGIRMPPPLPPPPPPPPPCGLPPGMTSRTACSSAFHVQVQQQQQHHQQRNAFNSNGNDDVRGGGSSSVSGQMMPECSQLTMSQFSSSQTGGSGGGGGGMYDSQHSGSNSHGSNHYGITATNTGGFHGHGPPQPASMHQQRIPPMQPSGVPIIDRYGTSSYPPQRHQHGPSSIASSQGPTTRMMQQQKQQYGASDDASTVHGRSQALLHVPPRPQPNRPPQIMAPPQLHQPFDPSFGPAIVPARPQQAAAPPRPQVLSTPSRIVQSAKEALWTIFTPNRKPPSSTFRRGPIGNGGGGRGVVRGNDRNGGFDRNAGLVAHHPASSPMSSSVASSKFVRLQPGDSQCLPQGSAAGTQAAASGGWRRLINAFTPSRGSVGARMQQKEKVQPPQQQQQQQQKQRKARHQPEGRGSVSSASTAAMVSVDSATAGDQGKDADETPKIKNKASTFATSALAVVTTTAAGGSDSMADITLLSNLEKTKQSIVKERTVMENKMKLFESKMKAREAALTIREKDLDTRTQEYESRVSEFHLSVDKIRVQFRAAREAEEELLRASARDLLLKAKEDVQRDFANDLRAKTDDEVLLLSPGSAAVAHDSAKRRKVEAPALGGSSSRPRTSLSKTRLATLFTNATANTENSVPLEGPSAGSSSSDQKKRSSKKSGDKKSVSVVLAKSDSPVEQKQGSRQSKVRAQATSSTEANVEHLSKEAGISPHNTAATSTSSPLSISSPTKHHQDPWRKEESTRSTTPAWDGESSKKRSKKAYGTRSTSRGGGNAPGAGKENNMTVSINSSFDGDKNQPFHQSLSQSAGYGRRRRKKNKKKQDLLVAGTFGEDGEFSFSK
mmetsp:Transcript_15101/g.32572  ORF Transcript_15101/g.32572 Transcript_15101/m.32572 type:complete len:992 (-) Transcript_15101:70-3045(-)